MFLYKHTPFLKNFYKAVPLYHTLSELKKNQWYNEIYHYTLNRNTINQWWDLYKSFEKLVLENLWKANLKILIKNWCEEKEVLLLIKPYSHWEISDHLDNYLFKIKHFNKIPGEIFLGFIKKSVITPDTLLILNEQIDTYRVTVLINNQFYKTGLLDSIKWFHIYKTAETLEDLKLHQIWELEEFLKFLNSQIFKNTNLIGEISNQITILKNDTRN
jgi:hypothetical protein